VVNVYGEINAYNRIREISSNYQDFKRNKRNNKREQKKFAEVLEKKSEPNPETSGPPEKQSHIDIKY